MSASRHFIPISGLRWRYAVAKLMKIFIIAKKNLDKISMYLVEDESCEIVL